MTEEVIHIAVVQAGVGVGLGAFINLTFFILHAEGKDDSDASRRQ